MIYINKFKFANNWKCFNNTLENTINNNLKWDISDVITHDGDVVETAFIRILEQSLEEIL